MIVLYVVVAFVLAIGFIIFMAFVCGHFNPDDEREKRFKEMKYNLAKEDEIRERLQGGWTKW